jgi:hypothetical protein
MQTILTDGHRIYHRRDIRNAAEQTELNARLQKVRFDAEGRTLSWIPAATAHTALPMAALRERARVGFEIDKAQAAHQEHVRFMEEMQRQREELRLLMAHILGECVEPEAVRVPEDLTAMMWADVTVTVEDLSFRVADYHTDSYPDGGYVLEVALTCPVCQEVGWHIIGSIGGLGLLLCQVANGSLPVDCPTCQNPAMLDEDPFGSV